MLFKDYEQQILKAYEQKKDDHELPHGLLHLTAANLRDECEKKCRHSLSKLDEQVIRDFCGEPDTSKSCQTIIARFDADKFKPLINFLNRKSETTNSKNVELLAWLMDFPVRPGAKWIKYVEKNGIDNMPGEEKEEVNVEVKKTIEPIPVLSDTRQETSSVSVKLVSGNTGIPEIPTNQNTPNVVPIIKEHGHNKQTGKGVLGKIKDTSINKVASAMILSLAIGTSGIWWFLSQQTPPNGSCMYWKEDHYEAIGCDHRIPGAVIIGLDIELLKNFQKITMPDTITYASLEKVWYSKIDNKIEFFTAYGRHPVIMKYKLRPITIYIIDKYIFKKNTQTNNSLQVGTKNYSKV